MEFIIQGNYGQGWEDVCSESSRKEARQRLREYNENETNYAHRLIERRAPAQEYSWEYTDTFGEEPNYCWVRRGKVKARSMLGAVRMAKAAASISGTDCRRENYGDMIALRPYGACVVLFVNS